VLGRGRVAYDVCSAIRRERGRIEDLSADAERVGDLARDHFVELFARAARD
jgi:hypothetical protein